MRFFAPIFVAVLLAAGCGEAPNGTEPASEAKRAEEARQFADGLKNGTPGQSGEAAARARGAEGTK